MSGDEMKLGPSANVNRRDFVKMGAIAGIGAALGSLAAGASAQDAASRNLPPGPETPFAAPPIPEVKIGYVGVGGMGSAHCRNLLKIEGCRIAAVCDIVPAKVLAMQVAVQALGHPKPAGYDKGPHDFERMCAEADLDLVYTATPWEWHVPVCLAAMKNGKHAATEVPAAVTLDHCWELVETSEKLKKHCVMMENCCYGRAEMMMLNMVRKGVMGELLHGECGYLHDLRGLKFSNSGEGLWRLQHSIDRDGNLYPTHGLGPIAQCMDVNRGDQFDYMVSMSSISRGLNLWAEKHFGADDPRAKKTYKLGDINVSLIRTKKGRTIYVVHDCSSPRPYSRINMLQGTNGIFSDYPTRIYIEGRSPNDAWEDAEIFYKEFEHPLWKQMQEKAAGAGHGGMDFMEDYRLIKCLREGKPLDLDVYDAAAWSAVTELSERSLQNRSKSMDFPDFTRGAWQKRPQLGLVEA
ncbi:MAG TPA: Gfo/Idh/MocA family oxidoreductase [Candidatus Brocadiia bacterium]|nr:Gfo/Idh/MocA family oxidoreductase [Candidatus Brocadiia bacterium]